MPDVNGDKALFAPGFYATGLSLSVLCPRFWMSRHGVLSRPHGQQQVTSGALQ
jgi:hypothetical protein